MGRGTGSVMRNGSEGARGGGGLETESMQELSLHTTGVIKAESSYLTVAPESCQLAVPEVLVGGNVVCMVGCLNVSMW